MVELAAEFDVAPSTTRRAVAAPREERRLYMVLGQWSFVSDPDKDGAGKQQGGLARTGALREARRRPATMTT